MMSILCLFWFIFSPVAVNPASLENKAYTDYASELDKSRSSLWFPALQQAEELDFKLMQICDKGEFASLSKTLQQQISSYSSGDNFQWTTISLGSTKSPKISYLLLAGSNPRKHSGESASPRTGSLVLLCHFKNMDSSGISSPKAALKFEGCSPLSKFHDEFGEHEYLGASGTSLNWNDTTVVFAYCDPLWRPDPKVPLGRCFLHLVRGGLTTHQVQEASFCRSGDEGGTRCGAGLTIVLSSLTTSSTPSLSPSASKQRKEGLSDLHLWVGQPLFDTYGRLQIVHDPFGEKTLTTINNPGRIGGISIGTGFGSALIDGYVAASGHGEGHLTSDKNTATLVGVHLSTSAGKDYGAIEWFAGSNESDLFSGFGNALARVSLKNAIGVVVGAPYASASLAQRQTGGNITEGVSKDGDTNRGRIYLFCHSNSQSRGFTRQAVQVYDDYLDGPTGSSHFGYSLANIEGEDSEGGQTIAVGAPDLGVGRSESYVYLVRVLSSCRFDSRPLQVIKGPMGAINFGAHLPAKSEDLDFNNWSDIVIPFTSRLGSSGFPGLLPVLGRPRLQAECKYDFPPWLSVQKITENDAIPVSVRIFLHTVDSREVKQNFIGDYLSTEEVQHLTHQVNPDWNATSKEGQRFSVAGRVNAQLNLDQGALWVSFDMNSKRKVEDMSEVDLPDKGVFVGYRFLKPCNLDPHDCGTCPLIDWSNCIARLPVIRFVCYPRPHCSSDVSLKVRDNLSKRLIFRPQKVKQEERQSDNDGSAEVKLDLTFGDKRNAFPELELEVFNFGPTMAGGVWLEMQFHGNLRYARLKVIRNDLRSKDPFISVSENETWAACRLDSIPAPSINDLESVRSLWQLKLVTYYSGFTSTDNTNFSLGAGVNITLVTGTSDPDQTDNHVYVNYQVVNRPRFRVSRGPKVLSSHVDNRSEPITSTPSYQRKVELANLGPRVQYTFQVEYIGPMPSLKNVYFRVHVPTHLAVSDSGRRTDLYLLYLFQSIRVPGGTLVDISPTITSYGDTSQQPEAIGRCEVQNVEEFLNPRRLVGIDSSGAHSRQRRNAIPFDENIPQPLDSPLNSSSTNDRQSTRSKPTFRRTPKEVLQCDRVGYLLNKPVCAEILCHVESLKVNRTVSLTFTGWLWARTIFAKHISDVELVSTLAINQGDIPAGVVAAPEPVTYFHLPQTFFFPKVRPKRLQQIPIWPIVVGVFVGVFCLALLVILLYLLGFFKRKKPALRKATWTRGGADETERQAQLAEQEKDHEKQTRAERIKQEKDRYNQRKHRKKLQIIHPSDQLSDKDRHDEQQLLEADSG